MKQISSLLLVLVLAGCSAPAAEEVAGTISTTPTGSAPPVEEAPAATTPPPSSPPAADPEPQDPTPSEPDASDPAPPTSDEKAEVTPPTRSVKRSFELRFVDAGAASPLANCVFMHSPDATRIHDGVAKATSENSVVSGGIELGFESPAAKTSTSGSLPLSLTLPPTNWTRQADSFVLLQMPDGHAAVTARLDISLNISGGEPTFAVGGCRISQ